MENNFKIRIEKLRQLINNAAQAHGTAFLGGAGVSTASGIPDFRSKDGLYNQKDIRFEQYEPEYLLSKDCLVNHPDVFYEFYRQKLDCRNVMPNMAHYKLAELEREGKLNGIITQNIDGLHQKAGSQKVYEIHGTTAVNYCDKCHKKYDKDYIFDADTTVPKCQCGGTIRPNVVLYGETLPKQEWLDAIHLLHNSDVLIVAGTSLEVWPAVSLLQDFYGESLVIVNHDETKYDSYATLIFREDIADVFDAL